MVDKFLFGSILHYFFQFLAHCASIDMTAGAQRKPSVVRRIFEKLKPKDKTPKSEDDEFPGKVQGKNFFLLFLYRT